MYGTESTTVQSSKLPETVENNDEIDIPPTKQRLIGTGRTSMQSINIYSSHALSANWTFHHVPHHVSL